METGKAVESSCCPLHTATERHLLQSLPGSAPWHKADSVFLLPPFCPHSLPHTLKSTSLATTISQVFSIHFSLNQFAFFFFSRVSSLKDTVCCRIGAGTGGKPVNVVVGGWGHSSTAPEKVLSFQVTIREILGASRAIKWPVMTVFS